MSAREKLSWRLQRCFSQSKRDIKPRSWRRPKFWLSNITKYCGVGWNRWASTLHCEQQRGRKKALRCRSLRGVKIRGARPSRVLVLLFQQHELFVSSVVKRKVRRRETQRPTRETR